MILADTSIWVDHLGRRFDPVLVTALEADRILMHPFIVGEIALGHLRNRQSLLAVLTKLPAAAVADDEEVLHLINSLDLFGRGLGYVDVHLLAAVRLTPGSALWTRDRRLHRVAESLALAAEIRSK